MGSHDRYGNLRGIQPHPPWPVGQALLAAAVLAKLLLLALALPAFEGTDEPFHLDRARAFAEAPLAEGWSGRPLDPAVVAAVRASPCGADLRRPFACPAWGGGSAWFNVLRPADGTAKPSTPVANYQDHQPPLYYAVAGAVLRLAVPEAGPRLQLLALRLLAVLLVLTGAGVAYRFLGAELRLALLTVLLLPGAAEALVRAGQEAAVFLWCAVMLAMVAGSGGGCGKGGEAGALRPGPGRPLFAVGLLLLAAAGPLIKLTAVPIVAFAALQRLWHGRRWEGAAVAFGGLVVFPLQLARGWALGGTLEFNAPPPAGATAPWWEPVLGVAHSAYTFLKTALWLGGWSVFRPPAWVLVAAALVVVAWFFMARPRRPPRDLFPHLGAFLLAAAGFVAFAVGKHRVFGVWGAVGGWYLWGWLPWLLLAHRDLVRLSYRHGVGRWWTAAAVAFLLAVNAAWLASAHRLYGG